MSIHVVLSGETKRPTFLSDYHRHETWEIVFYQEGIGVNNVGDVAIDFFPGRIILIPPHTYHKEVGDGIYRTNFIRVSGLFWPQPKVPCALHDVDDKLITMASYLIEEYWGNHANKHILCNALMNVMHQYLLRYYGDSMHNHFVETAKSEMIRNITNAEYRVVTTVEASGYCKDHFRRLFKRSTGFTPQAYLEDLRIQHAMSLLSSDANSKVNEVAASCGFVDPYYFTRVFRKYTGVCPREYLNRQKTH